MKPIFLVLLLFLTLTTSAQTQKELRVIQLDTATQDFYQPDEFIRFVMEIDVGIRSGLLIPYKLDDSNIYQVLANRISLEDYLTSYLFDYPIDVFDKIYDVIQTNEWPDIETYMFKEHQIQYYLPPDKQADSDGKTKHPTWPICTKIKIILETSDSCALINSIVLESSMDPDLPPIGIRYRDAKKFLDNWDSKYNDFNSLALQKKLGSLLDPAVELCR